MLTRHVHLHNVTCLHNRLITASNMQLIYLPWKFSGSAEFGFLKGLLVTFLHSLACVSLSEQEESMCCVTAMPPDMSDLICPVEVLLYIMQSL